MDRREHLPARSRSNLFGMNICLHTDASNKRRLHIFCILRIGHHGQCLVLVLSKFEHCITVNAH